MNFWINLRCVAEPSALHADDRYCYMKQPRLIADGNQRMLWFALAVVLFVSAAAAARLQATSPSWHDPEYLIERWEIEHGLPGNSATAMVQTSDGYLWFGTFNGLVRFDGVRFKVYDDINTPELPSSSVVNLHLDSQERLWVSTLRGMAVRDRQGWRRLTDEDGWSGGFVRTFAGRGDGEVLVTTFDGSTLEYVGGRFRELPPPRGDRLSSFGAADRSGRWWIAQEGFFGYWDGKQWVQPSDAPEVLTGVSCFSARDGGVWVVVGPRLLKYDGVARTASFDLPDLTGSLWDLYEDSKGNIWLSTHDQGVLRVSPDGQVRRWDEGSGLAYNGVRFVFEDHERSYWIGSSGGGLTRFTARRVRAFGQEHGLTERVVNTLWTESDGGVLIGTYGGGLYRLRESAAQRVELPSVARYIQSVLVDRTGMIRVGTFGCGLYCVDASGTQNIPEELTGGHNVIAQFEDSQGRLWVSGGQTIAVYEAGDWRSFDNSDSMNFYGTRAFAEDADGRIWAASQAGVFRLVGDRFTEVVDDRGESITGIICLHADSDGSIWLGSRSEGLARWRNGEIARVTGAIGSGLRTVGAIIDDGRGYRWMTTNLGLLRIKRDDLESAADGGLHRLRYQVLGVSDGLMTTAFAGGRQPVRGADNDGRLWFATTKGVASVDAEAFEANDIAPRVQIERIRALRYDDGKEESIVGIEVMDFAGDSIPLQRLVLAAGVRRVEIEYTALSFVDPAKVRFEVMIDGLDTRWRDAGDRREAVFYDLPPGDYVFKVRASNNDGVWSEQGASLAFRIELFLWQTLWFQLALVSLIVLASGLGAWRLGNLRLRRQRRDNERFKLVVESSPSSIVIVNTQGLISLVNTQAERDFGYLRDELIGSQFEMLVPERYRNVHPGLRRDYLHSPSARAMGAGRDLYGLRRDGTEFPIEIGLTPIDTADGMMTLASIINITERKHAELEQARQRNELAHLSRVSMLGELSGSLAHELNQPLTAVLSNAQAAQRFLDRDPPDIDEVNEILKDIVSESKLAGDVIRGLRLLLKKGEVEKSPQDMGELVRHVLRIMRSDLINHGVTVSTEIEPSLPAVMGDHAQLQQVVINLVMNASDAMSKIPQQKRKLGVTACREENDRVLVSVIDSGIGIPKENQELVFRPFYTTKDTGIGLGLAVCRTIINAHGGKLWSENIPAGGAAFHMSLPSVEADAK